MIVYFASSGIALGAGSGPFMYTGDYGYTRELDFPEDFDMRGKTEEELSTTPPFYLVAGPPLPEYVAKELYPSSAWELMKPPVSDYGQQVVEETARRLKEFMSAGNFILLDKFVEGAWSTTMVDYTGQLIHTPTLQNVNAEIAANFNSGEPSEITAMQIYLFMDVGYEYPALVWEGTLSRGEGKIADDAFSRRLGRDNPRGLMHEYT